MKTIAVRLHEGQDLLDEINKIALAEGVQAGVILSAVGGLGISTIRVPVIDGAIKTIHPENLEIVSLQGTVSVSDCHLHISVSDVDGRVWGGHLKPGCVIRMTCELVIGVLEDTVFRRTKDDDTGFDELVIEVTPTNY